MLVVALSLSGQVEKVGAYAGFAAFFGFAVLSILCFAQAREIKRLRDWAGRAPERAAEVEARVMADAARRTREPIPVRPATPAAAATTTPVTPQPAAVGAVAGADAAAVAKPATASDGGAAVATPAESAPAPTADTPAEGAPATPEPAKPVDEAAGSTDGVPPKPPVEGEPAEPAPAAANDEAEAAAAAAAPAAPSPSPAPAATPNGAATPGEVPSLPRATPPPRPGAATPPPRPAPAAPLRTSPPPTRRPATPPPRRPAAATPPRGRSGGRTALLGGGAVIGLAALVLAATQIFGGEKQKPKPNVPVTAKTAEPTPDGGTGSTPSGSSGPARADTVVAVLNGTTFTGLAASTADKIVQAGFKRGTIADYSNQARSASLVFYASDSKRRATEVAKLLNIPTSEVQPMDPNAQAIAGQDAKVVVVVGADQAP